MRIGSQSRAPWFPCSRALGLVTHDVSPAACSARTPSALLSIAAPRDVQSGSRAETELRQGPCHHRRKDRGTWIGRRSSIDARIQATAAINGRAITRPHTRSRGKTTARREGWRRRVSVSWAAPRPSPEFVRRPMSGWPISTIQPLATAVDAMRGNCPSKGGYHASRRRQNLQAACPGSSMPHRRTTEENAHAAQRRTAREVAQRDAGDAVRRENVHRGRGGLAPPDPPSPVGGLRPPLLSVQSSERAVARGRKKGCVCVCACEFHFYKSCTLHTKRK